MDQFWKNQSSKRKGLGDSSDDDESFIELLDEPKTKSIATQTDLTCNCNCNCSFEDIIYCDTDEDEDECKCECEYCCNVKAKNAYENYIIYTDYCKFKEFYDVEWCYKVAESQKNKFINLCLKLFNI